MYIDEQRCLYDGFKIRVCDKSYVQYILENSDKYGIEKKYNKHGVIIYPLSGNFLGYKRTQENKYLKGFQLSLLIEYKNGDGEICFEISGSFHKFFNNWKHNSNNYTYKDFIFVLDKISKIFHLQGIYSRVCNIEFGINIIVPPKYKISSKALADLCVIAKGKTKNENRTNRDRCEKGQSLYFENESTKSKIYAKSFQQKEYSNGNEIIRIESKICNSRSVEQSIGIFSFDDLYYFCHHEKAIKYFKKRFQHLLFYQPELEHLVLKAEEKSLLIDFIKPNFWQEQYKLDKKRNFKFNRSLYFSMLEKNRIPNISNYILDEINSVNTKHTV